jgi:hypothetical protein
VKDVQTTFRKEECASSTGQRGNDATSKDVKIKFRREECAEDTEHTAAPDKSTASASCFGSGFEDTTVPYPSQLNPAALMDQGSLPEEVVVCGVVAQHFDDV